MKLTTKQVVQQITQFWKAQSAKKKKIIIVSVAAAVAIAIVLTLVANSVGYVTLYSGLSSEELGKIASVLSDMNIDFKTGENGTIMVPQEQEAELQMTLASEGYPQSTLNYDIFSSNSGYMTTDYEKKQYLLFQLQDRLQAAIKTINGIDDAIVTISMPAEDSFVLEEDKKAATAAIVLDIGSSVELDAKQVNGIEALVCKSVNGLDDENIAIVSTTGEMLNDNDESQVSAYNRLELEKSISSTIQNNITKLLEPVFGADRLRVVVNTMVDINKKVSESTTYSPVTDNSGLVVTQDSSKESVSSSNGGGSGGVTGTSSNTGVTTYPSVTGTDSTGNFSESSSVNYLNNQLVEQTQRDGYDIKDTTISVLIGDESLTPSEINDYKQMIANAAGVTIDKVAITNVDFITDTQSANQERTTGVNVFIIDNLYMIIGIAVALIVIALCLFVFLKKKSKKKSKDDKAAVGEFWNKKTEAVTTEKQDVLPMPQEIVLNETREQNLKKQIKDFSSNSPDIVAQLIRTWLKEDEEK